MVALRRSSEDRGQDKDGKWQEETQSKAMGQQSDSSWAIAVYTFPRGKRTPDSDCPLTRLHVLSPLRWDAKSFPNEEVGALVKEVLDAESLHEILLGLIASLLASPSLEVCQVFIALCAVP